mmetsp:Transcript_14777/g.30135  ORF Transcript_14777/g.30135 Transcript_14777/m.30135 type:complete len:507 (-) Transcript_14777:1293-2813(-)
MTVVCSSTAFSCSSFRAASLFAAVLLFSSILASSCVKDLPISSTVRSISSPFALRSSFSDATLPSISSFFSCSSFLSCSASPSSLVVVSSSVPSASFSLLSAPPSSDSRSLIFPSYFSFPSPSDSVSRAISSILPASCSFADVISSSNLPAAFPCSSCTDASLSAASFEACSSSDLRAPNLFSRCFSESSSCTCRRAMVSAALSLDASEELFRLWTWAISSASAPSSFDTLASSRLILASKSQTSSLSLERSTLALRRSAFSLEISSVSLALSIESDSLLLSSPATSRLRLLTIAACWSLSSSSFFIWLSLASTTLEFSSLVSLRVTSMACDAPLALCTSPSTSATFLVISLLTASSSEPILPTFLSISFSASSTLACKLRHFSSASLLVACTASSFWPISASCSSLSKTSFRAWSIWPLSLAASVSFSVTQRVTISSNRRSFSPNFWALCSTLRDQTVSCSWNLTSTLKSSSLSLLISCLNKRTMGLVSPSLTTALLTICLALST